MQIHLILVSVGAVLVLASFAVCCGLSRISAICSELEESNGGGLVSSIDPVNVLELPAFGHVKTGGLSGNAHQRRIARRKSLRSGIAAA